MITVDGTHSLEQKIRLVVGILIGLISAALSLNLLLSFADGTVISFLILGSIGVALESAKILTWRMKGFQAIAVSLIALSILASLGSALLLVENQKEKMISLSTKDAESSFSYQTVKNQIAELDAALKTIDGKIHSLPPNYYSASQNLFSQAESLRERRDKAISSLTTITENALPTIKASPTTMFTLFSRIFRLGEDIIEVLILLTLSVLLEVSLLALTRKNPTENPMVGSPSHDSGFQEETELPKDSLKSVLEGGDGKYHGNPESVRPMASYERPMKSIDELFLEEMVKSPSFPQLFGRDAVAERLGVGAGEAKKTIKRLMEAGKIRAIGKRLFLVGNNSDSDSSQPMAVGEEVAR